MSHESIEEKIKRKIISYLERNKDKGAKEKKKIRKGIKYKS